MPLLDPQPLAVVKGDASFEDDSLDESKMLITVTVNFRFTSSPGEQQIPVTVAKNSTKVVMKAAVNAAIINTALAQGAVLSPDRILTIADLAGLNL